MPASQIYQTSITLNNDQIKALPTTPVEIIPPPGDNLVVVPLFAIVQSNLTDLYDNISGADSYVALTWGDYDPIYIALNADTSHVTPNTLFQVGGTRVCLLGVEYSGTYFALMGTLLQPSSVYVNKPISVYASNAAGNYTGGDPANTLVITISYLVISL